MKSCIRLFKTQLSVAFVLYNVKMYVINVHISKYDTWLTFQNFYSIQNMSVSGIERIYSAIVSLYIFHLKYLYERKQICVRFYLLK